MSLRSVRVALGRRVGRRGAALLFFGTLDLVYAWSMVSSSPEATQASALYRWANDVAPLSAWAGLWTAVGAICIYHALHHYDRFGFVAAIGVKVIWGLLALTGAISDDVTLGSVGIWLGLAGLVWVISGWPDPPYEDDAGEDDRHDDRIS